MQNVQASKQANWQPGKERKNEEDRFPAPSNYKQQHRSHHFNITVVHKMDAGDPAAAKLPSQFLQHLSSRRSAQDPSPWLLPIARSSFTPLSSPSKPNVMTVTHSHSRSTSFTSISPLIVLQVTVI
ncbi:hypothetical protein Hanom_Chr10g00901601 [Helianthus anomalus]